LAKVPNGAKTLEVSLYLRTPFCAGPLEIYGWFTEGRDTPDLKEAKALLEELGIGVTLR
jgi:hypothetical protein